MDQDRLWFEQAVDGLFNHALKHHRTPRLIAKVREAGIDLNAKLEPGYPAEVFARAVKAAATEIYPRETAKSGIYQLGQIFTEGYQNTGMGKALFVLLRTMGPRRALPRVGRNLRNVNNFVEARATEPLDGCFAVTFSDVDDLPYFYKGLFDAAGRILGAPRISAEEFILDGRKLTLFADLNATPHPKFATLWAATQAA
jgi:uncharacterized protein (TIGR02265 family)